jgi:hypothetical protein
MSALSHLFCTSPSPSPAVEAPRFSLGIIPIVPKRIRKAKAKAKAKVKAKPKPMPKRISKIEKEYAEVYDSEVPQTPSLIKAILRLAVLRFKFERYPSGWLFSTRGIPPAIVDFLKNAGQTFPKIFMTIITKRRAQKRYFAMHKCYTTSEPPLPVLDIYMKYAMKHERVRRAFRALALRWIRSKVTVKNTEDLLTGEVPDTPIKLTELSTRSINIFDARTIVRDMVSRLTMSHCTFFPFPKAPRNPYTNALLTEGQFYSLVQQLRRAGETHWSIEGLYTAKYNLKEFERDMYTKIKRTIHNTIFANPLTETAKEVLFDYIEDEHKEHSMVFEREIYQWAVEELPHHYMIHQWRVNCNRHYKVAHFPGESKEDEEEKVLIDAATLKLCKYPEVLVEKYEEVTKKEYTRVADRVAPVHIGVTSVLEFTAEDLQAIIAAMTVQTPNTDILVHDEDSTSEAD